MANYDYSRIEKFAQDITEKIGLEVLYTTKNLNYPNAHVNHLLIDPLLLINVLRQHLREIGAPKDIYIIYREGISAYSGFYTNFPENIYINVIEDKECWKRFTLIKEICSALVGHYQKEIVENTVFHYNGELDAVASVEDAFNQKEKYINNYKLEDGDIDYETFAIILATELMIPKSYRHVTKELLDKVDNGEITLEDVAISLMIPRVVLESYIAKGYFKQQ